MRWSYSRSKALDAFYCREGSAKKGKLVDKVAKAWKEIACRCRLRNMSTGRRVPAR